METYYVPSDEMTKKFALIWNSILIPKEVKFQLVGNCKLKGAVKIIKLNELSKHLLDKEVVIEINEEQMEKIGELNSEILIRQELAKIYVDLEKGKLTMVQPDVITFASVINKFGADDVINANQVVKLLQEQEEDAKKEKKAQKSKKIFKSNKQVNEFTL